MGIFSTREIAIIIYSILLILYLSIHKKGRSAMLSVIEAACKKQLVIPFFFVLIYASLFVYIFTYLPIWDWIYIKDIILWILFAGVPICFNATSRDLGDRYFRTIIFDNLKFIVLIEFLTGTFTFNIAIELILQPFLVILVILQSTAKTRSESVKKVVDRIVAITGLIILAFTISNAIKSIGNIKFVDIAVSFVLPLVLSSIYLPVAYCFAVYAKYEILFIRMKFKEPQDRKIRIHHRIKVIWLCKLSYKRVCKFLNHYVKRMYVNMETVEFENIINDFKTVEL